jgi:CheY-like chemotaxis protein
LSKIEQYYDFVPATLGLVPRKKRQAGWGMIDTKASILIVEDEPSIRVSMTQVLTEVGYQVRSAEGGFAALAELRQLIPDILLSDLNMPGMSGFELLSVVRLRFPSVHTVAMSGAFSGREVPSGVAADAFYQKGASIESLLRILAAMPHVVPFLPDEPSTAQEPIWVQPDVRRDGEKSCGTISCPDCLRTFSLALGSSNRLVHEADCIYCGSLIHYAVMQPAERIPVEVLQWVRAEETSQFANLSQSDS